MPLRDHFPPPISKKFSWEGFHGTWPGLMAIQLVGLLPEGYIAEPRVHLGTFCEVDVNAYEDESESAVAAHSTSDGGVATMAYAPPAPTFTVDADIPEEYAYEVLVYNIERERTLVAGVEIVSPANKDRPGNRQMFAAKCAGLLKQDVCLSIVDLVTIRRANLYAELLKLIGRADPALGAEPPATYAVTCRKRVVNKRTRFESWLQSVTIGQPLPTLPIWLNEDVVISLDLEEAYEQTCSGLRYPKSQSAS